MFQSDKESNTLDLLLFVCEASIISNSSPAIFASKVSHNSVVCGVIAKEIDITIPTNGFVYDGTLDSQRIVDRIGSGPLPCTLFVISFLSLILT